MGNEVTTSLILPQLVIWCPTQACAHMYHWWCGACSGSPQLSECILHLHLQLDWTLFEWLFSAGTSVPFTGANWKERKKQLRRNWRKNWNTVLVSQPGTYSACFYLSVTLCKEAVTTYTNGWALSCFIEVTAINLHAERLAYRFGVSPSSMSRIIHKWLDVMYSGLKIFISLLERAVVEKLFPKHSRSTSQKPGVSLTVQNFVSNILLWLKQEHKLILYEA